MRELLDPVSPESLRTFFTGVFRQLQRGKALEPMLFLPGYSVLALDGTGYFSSTTMHCQSCMQKVHRNGSITYYPYSATSTGTLKLPSVQRRCAIADTSPSSCHHREFEASIMASATPSCFCTTQKHLAVKRSRSSMA